MSLPSRRRLLREGLSLCLLAAGASLPGCRFIDAPDDAEAAERSENLLSPLAGDDHVGIEVYFVHIPTGDDALNEAIWRDVDEQRIANDSRRRLAQHGFRAGVVTGDLPQAVRDIIATGGATASAGQAEAAGGNEAAQPLVSRQQLRMRPSGKGEIVPCPPQDRMTLLTVVAGELTGQTLHAAQGRLIVRCQPEGAGTVRVSLAPQLQFGEIKRRFVGDDGFFRSDIGQQKLEFEHLSLAAPLAAGQMLVIGSTEQPLSSLGRDFLTDRSSGKSVRKLLVVRLLEANQDDSLL